MASLAIQSGHRDSGCWRRVYDTPDQLRLGGVWLRAVRLPPARKHHPCAMTDVRRCKSFTAERSWGTRCGYYFMSERSELKASKWLAVACDDLQFNIVRRLTRDRIISSCGIIIIIIIIIAEFVVRGLQNWPMAHYNCSYGVANVCKKYSNHISNLPILRNFRYSLLAGVAALRCGTPCVTVIVTVRV